MSFYKITAKCGHVGKDRYYEGEFFVEAESGKEAAMIARNMPRVKHHHKDAILGLVVVSYEEFCIGNAEQQNNPYFSCRNAQEQRLVLDEIMGQIFLENDENEYEPSEREDRLVKQEIMRKIFRKENKYGVLVTA